MRLDGRIALITGGAGLLGIQHAEAIAEMGGIPILLDINDKIVREKAAEIASKYNVPASGFYADITKKEMLQSVQSEIEQKVGPVEILINNAANNPKVEGGYDAKNWTRFENLPISVWQDDLDVGLTGAFLCSQLFGSVMAKRKRGVILNIASDLAVIAPDQRIYAESGLPEEEQNVKPVTYSVVKTGLLGLTRYLATYWADKCVRVNALSPGGVYTGQDEAFVKRLSNLIPMGRMAAKDEYRAAVVFLVSDASSFMTGANLIIEGGRTIW
ncbi:MAG: SDR family oxidoreductase [Candidatus Omnitrophota bacterium]|nr:MAG: SDR family oxidoreductase [Candidatus Omnitrophota bacterium]